MPGLLARERDRVGAFTVGWIEGKDRIVAKIALRELFCQPGYAPGANENCGPSSTGGLSLQLEPTGWIPATVIALPIRLQPHRLSLAIALAIAAVALAACQADSDPVQSAIGQSRSIKIVASTSILADIAANIAEPDDQIQALVPPGSDAHGWSLSPNQLKAIAQADLVIEIGLELDNHFMDPIFEAGTTSALRVVTSDGIDLIAATEEQPAGVEDVNTEEQEDGGHGEFDPHVWTSPANAKIVAANIRDALTQIAPDRAPAYNERFAAFAEELSMLDEEIRARFADLPPDSRQILSYHRNLDYFAARYGIEVVGSLSGGYTTEAVSQSPAHIAGLLAITGVDAVFAESGIDPESTIALADDAGVNYGGELTIDWLGTQDSGTATYLGLLNTLGKQIAEALAK